MQTLRSAGFCWVEQPDNYIAPLQLLKKGKGGVVDQLHTSIETIFNPNTFAVPAVSKDIKLTGEMAADKIIDLKLAANLSVLQNLTKIFSKNVDTGFTFQNSSTGKFSLVNPKKVFVDIGKLDAFIGDAELVTAAKTLIENLKDDELYVITEVVKSKGFTLETSTENKKDFSLNAGTVVADADTSFERSSSSKNVIKQEGNTYLTIAVKAYRIYYDKPGFFSGKPAGFHIKQEDIKVFRDDDEYHGTRLEQDITGL